jgi:tetratricopeptide (TPR) repeat protein
MEALLTMPKKIVLLLLVMLCLLSFVFAADPFYTNLLNEGKALFLAGKYNEALEDFKIAEFGLIDEKEFVPELYFYYALTQYKNGAPGESKALLEKMKTVLNGGELDKLPKPKEIERDLSIMVRALKYLEQPGAKPGSLPFFNLFYETWDLIKAKKLPAAEANLKRLDKMNGDEVRLAFLQGFYAFQKGDYKQCVKTLQKTAERLDAELSEDASFYLAFSYLKRAEAVKSEKFAQKIKNPEYVHQLMVLMDEIKAAQVIKNKKK